MTIVSGLAAPTFFSLLAHSRLRGAARTVLAQCQVARDLAIRRNTHTRVTFDTVEGTTEVLELVPEAEGGGRAWQLSRDPLAAPRRLPEGCVFDRMITAEESGEPQVTFSCDGRGEELFVSIRDGGDRRLAIHVSGTSGAAEILSPADGEAFERFESGIAP